MFSSYAFVRMHLKQRIPALETDGVLTLVRFNGSPSPIADQEIEGIRRVLNTTDQFEPIDYLPIGEEVEVIRGPLLGLKGQIIEYHGSQRLIIGVTQIRHGLSIKVHMNDIRLVSQSQKLVGIAV